MNLRGRRTVWGVLRAVAAGVAAASVLGCGGAEAPADGRGEPIRVSATIGEIGESPGRFACPRAIDGEGQHLWIVDKSARIQKIDAATGECISWFRTPEYVAGKPVGLRYGPGPDGEPRLYVADTHYHRILIYKPPEDPPRGVGVSKQVVPELLTVIGGYGTSEGRFIYPTDVGLLLTPDGRRLERLYVAEYGGNDRVSAFDAELKFLFAFGKPGFGEDPAAAEFQRPQCLAVERGGDGKAGGVYVVDSRNHRIGRFTLEGELLGWIGSTQASGRGLGELRYPYGMSLLGDGTAMVVEYGNNRVQRVDLATGRGIQVWGRPGRGPGELASPWGIAVLGTRTYVLDTGNNRVLAFANPRRRG